MKENTSVSGIRSLVDITPELCCNKRSFTSGEVILSEGTLNNSLFLILEGEVGLRKGLDSNLVKSKWIERLKEGAFLGLNSFWTREPVLADSVAVSPVACIVFDRPSFDTLLDAHPQLAREMYSLFADSLSQRYRSMVSMHVEITAMSATLTQERNQLKEAFRNLEATQQQMISREKLATLGELTAGIAHEINNPLAALISSSDELGRLLKRICGDQEHASFFLAGIAADFSSNQMKRERLESTLARAPKMRRSLARRISLLPEALIVDACDLYPNEEEKLEAVLRAFETAMNLRTISLSSSRLETLVKSLLNYGRRSDNEWAGVSIPNGLRDTVSILGNRLKHYELNLIIEKDLPQVQGNEGELNQVWTNLLVNAMDATPEGNRINVRATSDGVLVTVSISDEGEGIEPERLECVFETNFTTKKRGGSFGLGLGLSISKEIVEKHGGAIRAENVELSGARFIVNLPKSA